MKRLRGLIKRLTPLGEHEVRTIVRTIIGTSEKRISKGLSKGLSKVTRATASLQTRFEASTPKLERRQKQLEAKLSQLLSQGVEQRLLLKRVQTLLEAPTRRVGPMGPALPFQLTDPLDTSNLPDSELPEVESSHSNDLWRLSECPTCGHPEATMVCEYNKLLLLDAAPDEAAKQYDYSLCHRCGILYAARRPTGDRLRHLLTHFSESLGRVDGGTRRGSGSPFQNPGRLTDSDRTTIDRLIDRGVFVSEHLDLPERNYVDSAYQDRMAKSAHIELLGSLIDLEGTCVLEIRPKTGAILAALRRLYGAEVYALPIFESQQYVAERLYEVTASALIDFDRFSIPYDRKFDLVIANHMLTHAVRPQEFFDALNDRLRPGGHLYLYNENDDAEHLVQGQSMFNVLNPFHVQAFDGPSLVRSLRANGFETRFLGHYNRSYVCLATRVGKEDIEPIGEGALGQRLKSYRRARDFAILRAPEKVRHYFKDEWSGVVERAVSEGTAEVDSKGNLRILKPVKS